MVWRGGVLTHTWVNSTGWPALLSRLGHVAGETGTVSLQRDEGVQLGVRTDDLTHERIDERNELRQPSGCGQPGPTSIKPMSRREAADTRA